MANAIAKLRRALGLEDDESNLGRNLAMGGAAALPFAGAVGQNKVVHKFDQMPQTSSLDELRKAIREGDVILTGSRHEKAPATASALAKLLPDWMTSKWRINLGVGNPRGYHAALIDKAGPLESDIRAIESHPDLPFWQRQGLKHLENEHVTVLRPKLSPAEHAEMMGNIRKYPEVFKQLKAQLGGNQFPAIKQIASEYGSEHLDRLLGGSAYQRNRSMFSGMRNIFQPHLKLAPDTIEAHRAAAQSALDQMASPGGTNAVAQRLEQFAQKAVRGNSRAARAVSRLRSVLPADMQDSLKHLEHHMKGVAPSAMEPVFHPTQGRFCSNLVSCGLPKGRSVVPNVLPEHILPQHFLESQLYEPVAAYRPASFRKGLTLGERIMAQGPNISRLAVGAGLAGGVYGAHKLYKHLSGRDKSPTQRLRDHIMDQVPGMK